MALRAALVVHVFALAAAGCVHMLPLVQTPGPVDPPPSADPVPSGQGRVYVDVVDGPTQIQVVKSVEGTDQVNDMQFETETLEVQSACTTPCVLDLPLGRHLLAFPERGSGGVDLASVIASPTPTVYRRALGFRQRGGAGFVLGLLGVIFGGSSFATGAALLPVGLADGSHDTRLAGAITLGAGAVLTAAGIWAILHNPATEQAGAGAQYGLGR
ncbi:MAG TPA: hypothetical protein VGF94_27025 [Kofleriaceae bacterium]|jgi:hypothetical protein